MSPAEHPDASAAPTGLTRPTRNAALALAALTLGLMVLGAATRAARAGVACPDWPLCHGRWIPPLDAKFYPPDPSYAVYRVYLEFSHRVLAGVVAALALFVGVRAYREGRPRLALALGLTLAAQVAAGAVTVFLRNAPVTVIVHLLLALGFLAAVLRAALRPLGAREARTGGDVLCGRAARGLLALCVGQLVVGAAISSQQIGLACADFPLCNGLPFPAVWTGPIAWQMAHRVLGFSLALGAAGLYALARLGESGAAVRRGALTLCALLAAQITLGGLNVWLRTPPWASAAHLGCAVLIYATLVHLAGGAGGAVRTERLSPAAPGVVHPHRDALPGAPRA